MVLAWVAIVAATALILRTMGQPWWCALGDLSPWTSNINSAHNSQHLFDPYALTHVLHGVLLYGAVWLLLAKRLGQRGRFTVALVAEAAWEVFENTDFVINRYREATISLDYLGDSVLNSLGDIVACALGYGVAMTLPVWGSAVFFVAVELLLLLWIRDSLLVNVVMLVRPIEAIKTWQLGG